MPAWCALMSGEEEWEDIEDWGHEREAWLRREVERNHGNRSVAASFGA
ncbi:transposase family protein [Accumulibacter sp.]